jgi:hypothetical protein
VNASRNSSSDPTRGWSTRTALLVGAGGTILALVGLIDSTVGTFQFYMNGGALALLSAGWVWALMDWLRIRRNSKD